MRKRNSLFRNQLLFITIVLWVIYGIANYMLIIYTTKYRLVHCILLSFIFGLMNYVIIIKFFEKYIELCNTNYILQEKLKKDALTGLLNRKAFDESIFNYNKKVSYSVIFIDIDNFREFNNKFGHEIGDLVLRKVSENIKLSIGSIGEVFRYGGEEIVILLSNFSKDRAITIAEKIRVNILSLDNSPYPGISISLGVSSYPEDGSDISIILKNADDALLAAKCNGKNCTLSK